MESAELAVKKVFAILGAKVYGADAPEYVNWMAAEDVYAGSQAIQFSARLKIND